MTRIEKLNKLAKEKNIFRVLRLARNKYFVCKTQSDYVNFNKLGLQIDDLETFSYDQVLEFLGGM